MKKVIWFNIVSYVIILLNMFMPMSTPLPVAIIFYVLLVALPLTSICVTVKYFPSNKGLASALIIGLILLLLFTIFLLLPGITLL